jgi:hypothetical protein
MEELNKYLNRVRASADTVAAQLQQNSNVPLENYVDVIDLQALTDALSIDPSSVNRDDLARILMIRDSVHDALQRANDDQDEGSHSIEQLLNSMSRLYVDVERLVKENDLATQAARDLVQDLMATSSQPVQLDIRRQVSEQANAIVSNVQINQKIINLKILNFEFREINIFKEFRMNVKRLSASVFAIKLAFDKGIVFEGTVRFLNEGVDRIISDIAKFSEFVADKYKTVKEFLDALKPLVEKGTRFVKFIGNVIKDLFEKDHEANREIQFTQQTRQSSPILLAAVSSANGDVLFGGRRGATIAFHKRTGQFLKQPSPSGDDILAIGKLADQEGYAIGTPEGLKWAQTIDRNRQVVRSPFMERVTALGVANWKSTGTVIITGSKYGHVRRWSLSGGLTPYRRKGSNEDVETKLGRTIQSILIWGDHVVVAADETVWVLDEYLQVKSEIPIGIPVASMALLPDDKIAIVGAGLLGEVNLAKGAYQRMLTVPPKAEYVAVAHLHGNIVVAGTSNGIVRAIDLNNGAEIGETSTDIGLRGLLVDGNVVFAYGGSWSRDATSISKLLWKEVEATFPAIQSSPTDSDTSDPRSKS